MELTDTIEISLRCGRMIDVHRQQLTEELSFRGTMSAVGCGALLVLPALLIFAGWVGRTPGSGVRQELVGVRIVCAVGGVLAQFSLLPSLLIKRRE